MSRIHALYVCMNRTVNSEYIQLKHIINSTYCASLLSLARSCTRSLFNILHLTWLTNVCGLYFSLSFVPFCAIFFIITILFRRFHMVRCDVHRPLYTDFLFGCLVVDHSISFHGLVCILRVVSHILSVRQYKPSNSDNRKELPRFWSTKFVYIHFFRIILCMFFFAPLFCARFRFVTKYCEWENKLN